MNKTFTTQARPVRVPGAHLCPIEWAPDIDMSLATLRDFVADVDSANLEFDDDAVQAVRWSVSVLWYSAGEGGATDSPQIQAALASTKIDFQHVAALMLPFVDEMKPRIENRIAVAAALLATYCQRPS